MPQPFADDDDDDNLWGEGFADSSIRTLFPLWACTNICTGISSRHTHSRTHTHRHKEKQQIVYKIYCLRLRLLTMMKRQLNAISPDPLLSPSWT